MRQTVAGIEINSTLERLHHLKSPAHVEVSTVEAAD